MTYRPRAGPESGGTRIRLIGARFSNMSSATDFKCRFTSLDYKTPPKFIPAIYENTTSIVCPSPGGWSSGSRVNIEITFNGEDYTTSGSVFYFYSIFSAFPRSGPFGRHGRHADDRWQRIQGHRASSCAPSTRPSTRQSKSPGTTSSARSLELGMATTSSAPSLSKSPSTASTNILSWAASITTPRSM